MKVADLQKQAQSMGIRGISKMRKADLIDAISKGGSGSKAPAKKAPAKKAAAEKPAKAEAAAKTEAPASEASASADSSSDAPRRRRRAVSTDVVDAAGTADASAKDSGKGESTSDSTGSERRERNRNRNRRNGNGNGDGGSNGAGSDDQGTQPALDVQAAVAQELQSVRKEHGGDQAGQAKGGNADNGGSQRQVNIDLPEGNGEGGRRSRRDRNRRGRNRNRDRNNRNNRNNRGNNEEPDTEVREGDVLLPIAGILDVQDNHGFVRTSGYLPGTNDVYVTLGNVRRWGLRPGDAVVGAVRQPREGENQRQRQKFNALVRVDTVNGLSIEESQKRRKFQDLTPLYPNEQLRMETSPKAITPRLIDLVAPIGKGQRGLIVSPPKAGKTMVIQQIAKALEINNPNVHLMVVLVDERPEEVTDMRSIVKGEVIASTFDRPASDHTIVAELAIERAKRLVELGQDVVVLLDSLTRLSRAYNLAAPASGRILSGGVDASALYPPKKFFGAARNIEEGGSLTIIASALVETGSKMDEVIFEEFKGTGNMELRLSRQLADRRIFPAIDVNASGTRREEILLKPEELKIMWKLRRVLGTLDTQNALELVLGRLKDTNSNAEFLMSVAKQTPEVD